MCWIQLNVIPNGTVFLCIEDPDTTRAVSTNWSSTFSQFLIIWFEPQLLHAQDVKVSAQKFLFVYNSLYTGGPSL